MSGPKCMEVAYAPLAEARQCNRAQVEEWLATYCQDRGIDDTEEPLSPALSPSEGAREKPPQLWV